MINFTQNPLSSDIHTLQILCKSMVDRAHEIPVLTTIHDMKRGTFSQIIWKKPDEITSTDHVLGNRHLLTPSHPHYDPNDTEVFSNDAIPYQQGRENAMEYFNELTKDSISHMISLTHKTDREKEHIGDIVTNATPTEMLAYRTLGMAATDDDAKEYLKGLYIQYAEGLSSAQKDVNTMAYQQRILSAWVDPYKELTPEQQKYATNRKLRNVEQLESTPRFTLMRVLSKLARSKDEELASKAADYKNLVSEYNKVSDPSVEYILNTAAVEGSNGKLHVEKTLKNLERFANSAKYNDWQVEAENLTNKINNAPPPTNDQERKQLENDKMRLSDLKFRLQAPSPAVLVSQYMSNNSFVSKLSTAFDLRKEMRRHRYDQVNANLVLAHKIASSVKNTTKDFVARLSIMDSTAFSQLKTVTADTLMSIFNMGKDNLDKDRMIPELQDILDTYGQPGGFQTPIGYGEDNEIKCIISKAYQKEYDEIADNIAKDWDQQEHGHLHYKIKGIYKVEDLPVEEAFQQLKQSHIGSKDYTSRGKNCYSDLFYHGTGPVATSMILGHSGQFKLGKVKAGRMMGDGIYLADVSSKSAQYLCDKKFSHKARGSLLICEATLGKTSADVNRYQRYNRRERGYDTTFADKNGQLHLRNAEWCVHNVQGVVPRFIVDLEVY